MLILAPELVKKIEQHAEQEYPFECCGALKLEEGKKPVFKFYPFPIKEKNQQNIIVS